MIHIFWKIIWNVEMKHGRFSITSCSKIWKNDLIAFGNYTQRDVNQILLEKDAMRTQIMFYNNKLETCWKKKINVLNILETAYHKYFFK